MTRRTTTAVATADRIVNRNGQFYTATGKGIHAFRLRALIVALELKHKTGAWPNRPIRFLQVAKSETGLTTNSIPRLVATLKIKYHRLLSECEIVDMGE